MSSSVYDFYINTDYAKYLETADASYHSYTFLVVRSNETEGLENLMVSLQPDGSYKLILFTYTITEEEKTNLLNGTPVDLTNKVSKVEIDDDGLISDIFSKDDYCTKLIETTCSAGLHPYGYFSTGTPCDGYTETVIWSSPGCSGDVDTSDTTSDSDTNTNDTNNTDTNTDTSGQQNGGGTQTTDDTGAVIVSNNEICTTSEQLNDLAVTLNLDNALTSCLSDENKCEAVKDLNEFLKHNSSPEAVEFAQVAAQAICDGHDVDFQEKIINKLTGKEMCL